MYTHTHTQYLGNVEVIERAIDFIKAQDKDSYKCLTHLKSSNLKLTLFINLEKNIGRSLENPPKDSKTAGRYRAPSS